MKPPRPGTKAAAILHALRRASGLTSMQAFSYGDCHLAGTVAALKRAGHHITAEWQTGRTRYGGHTTRFKLYLAPLTQK